MRPRQWAVPWAGLRVRGWCWSRVGCGASGVRALLDGCRGPADGILAEGRATSPPSGTVLQRHMVEAVAHDFEGAREMPRPRLTFACELSSERLDDLFADGSIVAGLRALDSRVAL